MVSSTSNKYDLSWGNSRCVRTAFLEQLTGRPVVFGLKELHDMDYPPHGGDEALVSVTRHVIERQTGNRYRYILLTNGATGGITIALRTYAQKGYNATFTRQAPYFPFYPIMIKSAGLKHVDEGASRNPEDRPVALIDSPTNPQGLIVSGLPFGMPTILDAVYGNNVYASNYKPLYCDVMVGSYSKLLGLNGIRVGWIATNDELFYLRAKDLATAEYCGLSTVSMSMILTLLSQFKDVRWWESFELQARFNLDFNRGEWSKLEKFFGGSRVSPNGMFYYAAMDKACKRLMNKSGIKWTTGSACGHHDDFGRFNIGQDMKVVKNAVREILKNDRI